MLAGLSSTFLNIDSKGFDYRTTIDPWFRSLFVFQPKVDYMKEVPVWFKIHILAEWGFSQYGNLLDWYTYLVPH